MKIAYARFAAATIWLTLLYQFGLWVVIGPSRGFGRIEIVWIFFAFFTNLTNLLAAFALTAAARRSTGFLSRPGIVSGIAASAVLVGLAWNLLLRDFDNPQGLRLVGELLLHDVCPPLFLVWWWLAASRQPLRYAEIARWALYPVGYFFYALVRGAADGFYPYPFFNVRELGYAQVCVNGAGILVGFIAIAAALIWIANLRSRRVPA